METKAQYKTGFSIPEPPTGLARSVLHILGFHRGRENAIGRNMLLVQLAAVGWPGIHERLVRQTIHNMRMEGELICSTGGENGGYWLAANWQELTEYLEAEVHPRALDLLEQESSLKRSAEKRWGHYSPHNQYSLDI